MGRHGIIAVKAPVFDGPRPMAAVSSRLASVQFNESMPWLSCGLVHVNDRKGLEEPTQTARQVHSMCLFVWPASRPRCPW